VDDWFFAMKGLSDAFDGLQKTAPAAAHLVFSPAIQHVEINVNPANIPNPANANDPTAAEFEAMEAVWRDPALTKLGVPTGRAGFRTLVEKSNFLFKVDWGFVVMITKYRAAWPAYAPQHRDVIASFELVKNKIGLDKFAYTLAHEIGHTVEALDEYASSNCSVTEKCGFSNFPNANCAVGNLLSVTCLMKSDPTFAVCPATVSHFGWGDQDLDGILDPFDPTFVPFP
jgi:hypothetical protein